MTEAGRPNSDLVKPTAVMTPLPACACALLWLFCSYTEFQAARDLCQGLAASNGAPKESIREHMVQRCPTKSRLKTGASPLIGFNQYIDWDP
jgi:hypothetical protein